MNSHRILVLARELERCDVRWSVKLGCSGCRHHLPDEVDCVLDQLRRDDDMEADRVSVEEHEHDHRPGRI